MAKTKKGLLPGVYIINKADGSRSFRASLTNRGKHISLGSFSTEADAHAAYLEARRCLSDPALTPDNYPDSSPLPFVKAVCLFNLRDTGIYFGAPILLGKRDFRYYLSPGDVYLFDAEDLFYYASHRIMRRGGRLFVADYGSQIGIMTRYGIRSYAVPGRDYVFRNGNDHDLRYENIEIINRYRGVLRFEERGFQRYKTVIHVRSNYTVGIFDTEAEAAIAYNKAVDTLHRNGIKRHYEQNYLEDVGPAAYAEIYSRIAISEAVRTLSPRN
ncbi:MAG: hypothetical protein K5696_03485 [Lachnospiraceae bacterium]|nr:hypothetical protein [Lachnospiraceae bacterium]